MKVADFVRRADELLSKGQQLRGTVESDEYGIHTWVPQGKMDGFRAACLSFLTNTFGTRHPYVTQFTERVTANDSEYLDAACEIVQAARDEVAGGWTVSLRSLVSAEIFSDFADMASYLLSEGYKDPAAVVIGSVLEEHLRQLAQSNGIDPTMGGGDHPGPKKADRLNADLANAAVYSKLDQKSVTAWLDLRNKAAHGKYSEYTREQVQLMHQGVVDFMARSLP